MSTVCLAATKDQVLIFCGGRIQAFSDTDEPTQVVNLEM
jgi:hypothetical protein